jgi:PhzF family phenazine biosynthesis protein
MQKVASEMNLSETVFVFVEDKCSFSSSSRFSLRWFSPTCEVNMCGHGTLAAAAVLWSTCSNENNQIVFDTLGGALRATITDNSIMSIYLPSSPSTQASFDDFHNIIQPIVGQAAVVDECHFSESGSRLLIRLSDDVTRAQLESLAPDTHSLLEIQQEKVKGVIVTVKSHDGQYDFLSRYFAPWWGNHEDHVTGASHTTLVPYWSKVLGKDHFKARQCSSRGGELLASFIESENLVKLTGSCCIIMQGTILV